MLIQKLICIFYFPFSIKWVSNFFDSYLLFNIQCQMLCMVSIIITCQLNKFHSLWGFVLYPSFVVQDFVSCNYLAEEERAGCFNLIAFLVSYCCYSS